MQHKAQDAFRKGVALGKSTLFLIVFCCLFFEAYCDLYVSSSGSDLNNGSISSPFLTIDMACQTAINPAFGTIYVLPSSSSYQLSSECFLFTNLVGIPDSGGNVPNITMSQGFIVPPNVSVTLVGFSIVGSNSKFLAMAWPRSTLILSSITVTGSWTFLVGTNVTGNLVIFNSTFNAPVLNEASCAFQHLGDSMIFQQSSFYSMSSGIVAFGDILASTINIIDCSFTNSSNYPSNGSVLVADTLASVIVQNSIINGAYAVNGGALSISNVTLVGIFNNQFINCNAYVLGAAISSHLISQFVLSNNTFTNNYAPYWSVFITNSTMVAATNNTWTSTPSTFFVQHVGSMTYSYNSVTNASAVMGILAATDVHSSIIENNNWIGSSAPPSQTNQTCIIVFGMVGSDGSSSQVNFDSNTFESNECTLAIFTAQLQLKANIISNNTFEVGPALLVATDHTGNISQFAAYTNTFYNNTCISPPYFITANDLAFSGDFDQSNVILQDNVFTQTTSLSSVALDLVNSTFNAPSDGSGFINIPGLIVASSTVNVMAQINLMGATYFLATSADGATAIDNYIYLNGYTMALVPTQEVPINVNGLPGTILQNGLIYNGTLDIVQGAGFCCDNITGYPQHVHYFNTTVNIYSFAIFAFSATPHVLDPLSSFVVQDTATVIAFRPQGLFSPPLLTLYGHLDLYGSMVISDFMVVGNMTTYTGSKLLLFPSHWRGKDHPLNVTGTLELNSSIILDYAMAYVPFEPLATINDAPATVITAGNLVVGDAANTIANPLSVPGGFFYNLSISETSLVATPWRYYPSVYVDSFKSGLEVYLINPDLGKFGKPDCTGILSDFTGFDQKDIRCHWKSPTTLLISSSLLPDPGTSSIHWAHPEFYPTSYIETPDFTTSDDYPLPVASITMLPSVTMCSDIALDASPSLYTGSFPIDYKWNLTFSSQPAPQVENFLQSLPVNSQRVVIPESLLQNAVTYQFGLSFTNIFGQTASTSSNSMNVVTTYSSSIDFVPSVYIEGPSNFVWTTGKALNLVGKFSTLCSTNIPSISYQWFFIQNGTQTAISMSNTTALSVPANSHYLVPTWQNGGVASGFLLRAFDTSNSSIFSESQIVYITISDPIPVIVYQGSSVFYDSDVLLTLSLLPSFIPIVEVEWEIYQCPDNYGESSVRYIQDQAANSSSSNYTLAGQCIDSSTAAPFDVAIQQPTISSALIPKGNLADGEYIIYISTIALVNGQNTPVPDFFIPISYFSVAPSSPLNVEIVPPVDLFTLDPSRKLYFGASVNGITGSPLIPLYDLIWNVTSKASPFIALTNLTSPTLVIPYSTFVPGEWVFVELKATIRGGSQSFISVLNFTSSIAPYGGSFIVNPSSGIPWSTSFTLSALSWTTPNPSLSYQFSIAAQNGFPEIPLSETISTPILSNVILPSLRQTTELTILVRIQDAQGIITQVNTSVSLQPYNETANDIIETVAESLKLASNSSNWRLGLQLINIGIDVIGEVTLPIEPFLDLFIESASQLAPFAPQTESGVSLLLLQFETIANVYNQSSSSYVAASTSALPPASLSQLGLQILHIAVTSGSFGSNSNYAASSFQSSINILSTLLKSGFTFDPNSPSNPVSYFENVGSSSMDSMILDELQLEYNTDILQVVTGQAPATLGAPIVMSMGSLEASTSIDPSSMSSSNGYIPYFYQSYANSTFPFMPSNGAIPSITSTNIILPSGSSTSSPSYSTTFDTSDGQLLKPQPSGSTMTCATYDGNNWSSNGCTTTTSSDSTTCTCVQGGPLTVLFGPSLLPPPGSHRLSTGDIIAIVFGSVIAVGVVTTVILFVFYKPIRHMISPYSGS